MKLTEVTNSLCKVEENEDGVQIHASSKPYVNKNLSENQKNLDAMARLLTGDDVCTAVCYDGGQLLVAANSMSPSYYAKEYMGLLSAYAQEPLRDNYNKLEKEAYRQVELGVKGLADSAKFKDAIVKAGEHNDDDYLALAKNMIKDDNIDNILSLSEKILSDQNVSRQSKELAQNILRPLIDTRNVARAIAAGNGQLDENIIEAIQASKIKYLDGEHNKHAEMKISEELVNSGAKADNYYIGISKLACCPCGVALSSFKEKGINLQFGGTHGGTYMGWKAPEWLSSNVEKVEAFTKQIQQSAGAYAKIKDEYPIQDVMPKQPDIARKFGTVRELINYRIERSSLQSTLENKLFDKTGLTAKEFFRDYKETKTRLESLVQEDIAIDAKMKPYQVNLDKLREEENKIKQKRALAKECRQKLEAYKLPNKNQVKNLVMQKAQNDRNIYRINAIKLETEVAALQIKYDEHCKTNVSVKRLTELKEIKNKLSQERLEVKQKLTKIFSPNKAIAEKVLGFEREARYIDNSTLGRKYSELFRSKAIEDIRTKLQAVLGPQNQQQPLAVPNLQREQPTTPPNTPKSPNIRSKSSSFSLS